jgi:hypothetical protein
MRPTAIVALAMVAAAAIAGGVGIVSQRDMYLGFYAYVACWLIYAATGGVLAALRPRSPIGWLFAAMGLASELGLAAESIRPMIIDTGVVVRALDLVGGFWFIAFQLVAALLILFPDGRTPSPRWRIALALIGLNTVVGTLSSGSVPERSVLGQALVAAFGSQTGAALAWGLQGAASLVMFALIAAGAVALVRRTRRSRGIERQQLKWISLAGVLVVAANGGTAIAFLSPLRALDPDAPFPAALFGGIPVISALIAVPLAAAIAILRHRLYDIDLLIKRTLVYGATTAAIAVTFFVGIVALQAFLSRVTSGSELAVAASTLVSFALFQPIRGRVRNAVDRRFDRTRYDAARTLDAFADRLRDQVDLDSLSADLLGAVRTTMAPAHASLWLRGPASRGELKAERA